MPKLTQTVAALILAQLFAWSAMFLLWVFALPMIRAAMHISEIVALQWVGIGLALLASLAALLNFLLPRLVRRLGATLALGCALLVGSLGLWIIAQADSPTALLAGYALVGVGWAGLANLPYKIILHGIEEDRIDPALARFNLSVVVPQVGLALALPWLFGHFEARFLLHIASGLMATASAILIVSHARMKSAA